jgi:hypothetical protein
MSGTACTIAVIDGIVCVGRIYLDMAEPVRVTEWLPTTITEGDLRRTIGASVLDGRLGWVDAHPGEVFIGIRSADWRGWVAGRPVRLAGGMYTLPIRVDREPVEPPKVRRGTTAYWTPNGWEIRRRKQVGAHK